MNAHRGSIFAGRRHGITMAMILATMLVGSSPGLALAHATRASSNEATMTLPESNPAVAGKVSRTVEHRAVVGATVHDVSATGVVRRFATLVRVHRAAKKAPDPAGTWSLVEETSRSHPTVSTGSLPVPSLKIIDLPPPAPFPWYAVNDSGQLAGGVSSGSGANIQYYAARWTNGTVARLGTAGGVARGIDDAGDLFGAHIGSSGDKYPTRWTSSGAQDIDATRGIAFDSLNGGFEDASSNGTALGVEQASVCSEPCGFVASPPKYAGTTLPGLSFSGGVNNLGHVATYKLGATTPTVEFYDGRSAVGTGLSRISGAGSLNNLDQIVGLELVPVDEPALWNAGKLTELPDLPTADPSRGFDTSPEAINDSDVIVGNSYDATGSQVAVIWQGGKINTLNSMLPKGSPWNLTNAIDISNTGYILGYGMLDGVQHEFLTKLGCSDDPDVADGEWEFGGCFTNPDKTDYDTTQESQLDGLDIEPDAGSSSESVAKPHVRSSVGSQSQPVDYSNGGKKGEQVISKGSVTISLNIDGIDSPIWQGRLDWKLTGKPITMSLPQGTFIKGIPVSGTLTLTPKAGGTVEGTVLTTLPAVLGGGKAKLTFTSVYGKGVSQMQLIATNASLGKLFTVTKPTLTYDNGKWTASGRVGTSSGPLDLTGSLIFDKKGVVGSGGLKASNVALAKLWNLQTFSVTYGRGTWKIAGKTKGANASAFQGTLIYDKQGTLTKGIIQAVNVSLGSMFTLQSAALTYSAGSGGSVWTASGNWGDAKKPSTFQGKLQYDQDSNLVGGQLTVTNVALARLFDVKTATFTYAAGANGSVWSAAADVVGADGNPVTFSGKLGYDAQGVLTDGSLTGTGLSLGGLFKLDNVSFTYTSGQGSSTWSLSADATGSSGDAHHLGGSLTFDPNGVITKGDLKVDGLTLAGLITLNSFSLIYDQANGWAGSASITEGNASAKVDLAFSPEGQLTSGSFHAESVPLFGVLALKTFDLDYDASKGWKLSVTTTLKNGANVSVDLHVVNGAVTGANLDLTNVSFAGKLTIDSLDLMYSSDKGQVTFGGAAMVTLPGPDGKSIKGSFTFVDGKFTQGSLEIKGLNVPLGYGIFLDKLGASIAVQYEDDGTVDPVSIAGDAGLTAGPRTAAGAAMAVDGQLEYDWPLNQKPEKWDITGGMDVANVRLGNGEILIEKGTTALTMTLGAGDGSEGLHLGKLLTMHGKLSGTFDEDSISATGTADFTVGKYAIDGNVTLDAHGLAGCGTYNGSSTQYGFNWVWGQYPKLERGDCSLSGF